jgi:predicted HAD superfamily Cof-like phosphohydrolase
MTEEIYKVGYFHKKFNQDNRIKVTDSKEMELRLRLIQEEVDEMREGIENQDIVEVADALIDQLYITFGTLEKLGLADVALEMFNEVHRSNLSKLDRNGNPIFRRDGKILKSNQYSPPILSKFITA